MAHYNDGTRYGSGARYGAAPIKKGAIMAKVKTNIHKLTKAGELLYGDNLVAKAPAGPPPAGSPLAAFLAAHADYKAKNAASASTRMTSKTATTEEKASRQAWKQAVSIYAASVQSSTGGDAAAIQTLGFDVQQPPTPMQPVGQVLNLKVVLTELEGYSRLSWDADPQATHYVIESSVDPIVAGSFKFYATSDVPFYTGNGAVAGQKCWYRVAAVNTLGQGGWSDPAQRPVM